jgi:hypothetical protein
LRLAYVARGDRNGDACSVAVTERVPGPQNCGVHWAELALRANWIVMSP